MGRWEPNARGRLEQAAMELFLERGFEQILERGFEQTTVAEIAAHAELRERELIKLASLAAAIAGALRERGVADPAASLTAEAGMAVFRVAFERWVNEPGQPDLPRLIRESLEQLKAVTAGR